MLGLVVEYGLEVALIGCVPEVESLFVNEPGCDAVEGVLEVAIRVVVHRDSEAVLIVC